MKKLLFLLLVCSVAEAKPKYRLQIKVVGTDTVYFPQAWKKVPGFYTKQWVDVSNQPLHNKDLAMQLIGEVRLIDQTIRQTQIINVRIN
jgi:hypothetical protein